MLGGKTQRYFNIFSRFATVPLSPILDSASRRRINLTNQICIFILLQVLVYTVVHLINGRYLWVWINLGNCLLYLVAFLANYRGYHEFAKSFLICHFSLTTFVAGNMTGRDSGSYLYFLVVICMIFALFNLDNRNKILIHLLIPLTALLALELTDYSLLNTSLTLPEDLLTSFRIALFITFFLIAFFMNYSLVIVKEAEENKYESDARLSNTLDSLSDVVWGITVPDYKIEYINKAVFKLYGYSVEECYKANYIELSHIYPEDRSKVLKAFEDAYNSPIVESEYRIITKNGEIKTIFNRFSLIRDKKGRPVKMEGIAADITERKKVEEELRKTVFELDSFVYRASHDMRAPLLSILGLVMLLKEEQQYDQRLYFLELIDRSIKKLDRFILDMTDFARNTEQEVKMEKVNFEIMAEECISELQYMDNAARITFKKNIICNCDFYSDRFRITSIFKNLISNAIKYQNTAIKEPTVEIKVQCRENEAILQIKDNGKGIESQYIDKVFNMFFKASIDSSGSGLGLYIVKQMIDKLGGKITINSSLGIGTKFEISIPNQKQSVLQGV